ncbi:MFS transporter [Cryptosporangium minutisporangium]|uniref:MFS transporter n=1 Tax=Cryptosporangium minutisporangium TaxID=113569 RepID=UPI0031EEC288
MGYAVGDAANNLAFSITSFFLLIYYTDVVGISAAAAGTLFLLILIWGRHGGRAVPTVRRPGGRDEPAGRLGRHHHPITRRPRPRSPTGAKPRRSGRGFSFSDPASHPSRGFP